MCVWLEVNVGYNQGRQITNGEKMMPDPWWERLQIHNVMETAATWWVRRRPMVRETADPLYNRLLTHGEGDWRLTMRDIPKRCSHWPRCSIPMNRENWITGDKDVTWNRWQRNVKHYYILIILYRSRSPWNLGQASGRRHDATCPASSWSTWPTTIARLLCRVRRTASTSAFTHRRLVAHATYCPKTDIKNTGIRIRLTFILSAADEVT